MTGIIYKHIPCAAILTLLYTSMFSDGMKLYPEDNPCVGRSFRLSCDIQTTVISTITIGTPDNKIVGSCSPASPPFPAECTAAVGYDASLNGRIVTISISSLASDVNGTWTCTHNSVTGTWFLPTIREIEDEIFSLYPTSFTQTITRDTSIRLTVTYKCINMPVYFTWFAVDISSAQKTRLEDTSTAEVDSSLCTTNSGLNAYTETRSISYITNLDGRYRIGVEVHYSGEVSTLQSIQYFNTSFIFGTPTESQLIKDDTTTKTTNDNDK